MTFFAETGAKDRILHFEKCSLDRAIEIAKKYGNKIWGFSVYDLLFTDGFNAIYQLKKYGKVFADMKLTESFEPGFYPFEEKPDTVDYLLQCAWAAGADIVSIKEDSQKFTKNIAAYATCNKQYDFMIQEWGSFPPSKWITSSEPWEPQSIRERNTAARVTKPASPGLTNWRIISLPELMLSFPDETSKISV